MQPPADTAHTRRTVRKSHERSRAGCTNCKKLRVKCDEEKPNCARCRYKRRVCVYTFTDRDIEWEASRAQPISHGSKPGPAALVPIHLAVTKEGLDFRFYVEQSVPLLCILSSSPSALRLISSLFPTDGSSILSSYQTSAYDRLWKFLIPALVYDNPTIYKMVCFFGSLHRAAVDSVIRYDRLAELKLYDKMLKQVLNEANHASADILIAISIMLFVTNCLWTAIDLQVNQFMVHVQAAISMIVMNRSSSSQVVDCYNPVREHFESLFIKVQGPRPLMPQLDSHPYVTIFDREQYATFRSTNQAIMHFTNVIHRCLQFDFPLSWDGAVFANSNQLVLASLLEWRSRLQAYYREIRDKGMEKVSKTIILLYDINVLIAAVCLHN